MKPDQDDVMALTEIERRYPDEWVLVEVVRDHKRHDRIQGRLVVHSPQRDGILGPHHQFRSRHPDAHLYTFFTGDVVPKDRDFVVVL